MVVFLRGICSGSQQRLVENIVSSPIGRIHLAYSLFDQILLAAGTEIGKLGKIEVVLDGESKMTVSLTSFYWFFSSSFFIRDILISLPY